MDDGVKHYVDHSGVTWICLGFDEADRPIWPIEEFFARVRVTRKMRKKLLALNPRGKPEGNRPNGWPSHKRMYPRHGH